MYVSSLHEASLTIIAIEMHSYDYAGPTNVVLSLNINIKEEFVKKKNNFPKFAILNLDSILSYEFLQFIKYERYLSFKSKYQSKV